jgi:aminopeptidase N
MSLEHRSHARCHHAEIESLGAPRTRPFATSTATRHFERDRPFAVTHLDLDITLEVPERSLRATATLEVRRTDPTAEAVEFDAVGFEIADVRVDEATSECNYDGRKLRVPVDLARANVRVTVSYRATPRRGLYFIEPDEHYPNKPRQVWSQCQEEDARHWFPCDDSPHAKMTTQITAHVPSGWFALSNGKLVSSDSSGSGESVYRYALAEPHSSYLVTLVAGEFSVLPDTVHVGGRDVPLTYVVPKGREDDGLRTFSHTARMIEHFGERTGVDFPWDSYAQVVVSDFIFGGMENTTATTMYEHILLDERASLDVTSDDLIAHELAHQWFGDFVTCRDWYEGWLNEGFATFFEHVWREKYLGPDEYDWGIKGDLETYLAEARTRYRRPIVCQDYDAPLDLFDRHLYEKGGVVLHALRLELGDALFWRGVHIYLARHARGVVETRDLRLAMEEASGRSLGRAFEQWVNRPGHPELSVTVAWDKGVLTLTAQQTQSTSDGVPSCFELSIDVDVVRGPERTAERHRLRLSERQQSFAIPSATRPAFVVVDPESRIVGETTVKAPADMLREQLEHAASARGRWLAAQALFRSDDPATLRALGRVLADEREFWGTRAECANTLGKLRLRECFDILSEALRTPHPKVRRAVVGALGSFRTTAAAGLLKPVALGDESYLVEGEAARALGKTRQSDAFDTLVELLDRPSWFDVVRAGAIEGLAALRDDRAVPHLRARVRYGQPMRMRRASVLALPKLASDRATRETIEDLLEDRDPILRVDAVRALGELGDAKARPALVACLETDLDSRVRRRIREVLRDLGDSKRASDALRDEIEKLQDSQSELKTRLVKLEARLPEESKRGPRTRAVASAAAKPARGKAKRKRP